MDLVTIVGIEHDGRGQRIDVEDAVATATAACTRARCWSLSAFEKSR